MASGKNATNGNKGEAGEEKVNGGSAPAKPVPPAGYESSATNVDQFWIEAGGPIHGKLIAAKSYLNKLAGRVNKIYIFDLADPCITASSKGETFDRPAAPRELVGVWGSPGMRDLDGLGGCFVWMARDGEKDLGRKGQKPMKTYIIRHKGTPAALRIIGGEALDASSKEAQEAAQESDGLPF